MKKETFEQADDILTEIGFINKAMDKLSNYDTFQPRDCALKVYDGTVNLRHIDKEVFDGVLGTIVDHLRYKRAKLKVEFEKL